MTEIRGAAAITGAASGIGRALALELAARGCDLALADRDEAGLQAVAAEIAQNHAAESQHPPRRCQRARRDRGLRAGGAIQPIPASTSSSTMPASPCSAQFSEIDQAQMDWLMNINFWGVVHSTRAFLPHLARQREAHIVNVSSIFGIVAPPGQTAYAAAKFAVRGFSEALRHELQMATSPIKLSVVHPGGVATNIARNSRAGVGVTDNARRAQSIERFDAVAQDHAEGRRAADHPGHREEPAPHPDRQRRPLHGPAATFSSCDLLGADGAPDREDDEGRGSRAYRRIQRSRVTLACRPCGNARDP